MTDAKSHVCVLCEEVFSSKGELQDHFRQHASRSSLGPISKPEAPIKTAKTNFGNVATFTPPSQCELCGVECLNVRSYWQHYRRYHPEWRGVDCPHCGKHFLHTSDYSRHKTDEHENASEEEEFCCDQCDAKFFNQQAINYHMEGHAHVQQLESVLQDQAKQDAVKKARVHSTFTLRASYCKLCSCQFATSVALAQHLVYHGLFLCLTCGKELGTDEAFRQHQVVHLPQTTTVYTSPKFTRSRKIGNAGSKSHKK